MDSMGGTEVPDILPEIKQIDISDEEYQKLKNLFQPERSKREDSFSEQTGFKQFLEETFDRRMEIVEQLQKERDAVL